LRGRCEAAAAPASAAHGTQGEADLALGRALQKQGNLAEAERIFAASLARDGK
jgi:Flp pilus assembly protein TadD